MIDRIITATLTPVVVTCATEGCANMGAPLRIEVDAAHPYAVCGACGLVIADVQGAE